MRALAFLLSFCLPLSATFYFHVGEREEKCIIEDIPSDTLITALRPVVPTEMHQQECQRALGARHPHLSRFGVFSHHFFQFALLCFEMLHFLQTKGSFKLQQWDVVGQDFLESAPGLGLFVTVTTYSEEVLLSKLYGPQGTFHFTSHSPGEHIICLESNSTRLVSFGGSKLRIHLDIRVGEHDLEAAIAQAKDKVNEVSFKLEHLIEQIEQIVKEQNYQRDREENFRVTSEDTNSNVLWWAFAQTLILISVGIFQMKYLKDFFIAKKLV